MALKPGGMLPVALLIKSDECMHRGSERTEGSWGYSVQNTLAPPPESSLSVGVNRKKENVSKIRSAKVGKHA